MCMNWLTPSVQDIQTSIIIQDMQTMVETGTLLELRPLNEWAE